MPEQNQILSALSHVVPGLSASSDWLPLLLNSDPRALRQQLARKYVPLLCDLASHAIIEGDHQSAVNWVALGLYCHQNRMADEIRRRGVFRCSKYRFRASCLRRIVARLLADSEELSLSGEFVQYIQSVSTLLGVATEIRSIDSSLRKYVVRRRNSVLKSVVALVDSLFMLEHAADPLASTENWQFYSKESLAEGGSYLIHCFDHEIGIDDSHFNFLDEDALSRGLYHKLLVKACKIRRFLESEILIDAFDYHCMRRGRKIIVEPPFPELEMSIRLGYIQSDQADQRALIDRLEAMRQGQPSVIAIADLFYDRFRDQIVKTFEWPSRRYVFMFPDAPDFRAFFSHHGLLVEERIYLKGILDAELATWEELKCFEVGKGLSVFDLLKVQRLFIFLRQVAKRHLEAVLSEDAGLAYRSLVPVFEVPQLENLLGWCLPRAAVDTAIELLSWKGGARGVVDLQYKPILRGERYCLTPLNITGTINWYRNLAYTQKKRVIDVAEQEAASRALAKALGRVSGHVRKGFETTMCGEKIEIDVVSRFGEYLFIFECKHALLPCNVHEMRTSFEHIKKAALTLTRISALLSDRDNEVEFYKRLGWDVAPAQDTVTCIVSCNGMFPGLTISGHPIRRWTELRNIIETGIVRVGSVEVIEDENGLGVQADHLIERNVWGGPELTPAFLRQYVKEGWLQKMLFGAMVNLQQHYRLKTWELVFPTFALDLVAAQRGIENLS